MIHLPIWGLILIVMGAACAGLLITALCTAAARGDARMDAPPLSPHVAGPIPGMSILTFTTGDQLPQLQASLRNHDGTAVDLATSAVSFLMVRASDNLVKVNYADATIVGAPAAGVVTYVWAAGDVDTSGEYFAWFVVADGWRQRYFPPDTRGLRIRFVPVA